MLSAKSQVKTFIKKMKRIIIFTRLLVALDNKPHEMVLKD